jgi:undecaprenyl diphosphate synthase
MDLMQLIDKEKLPRHVAVIMDGNGRWATQRGKDRNFGHEHGVEAVRDTVKAAAEIGVSFLTFFAFSTENWCRPAKEVDTLMELLVNAIRTETPELDKNGVKLIAIGNIDALPQKCQLQLEEAIQITSKNTKLTVCVALSYSARWEITTACQKIAQSIENKLFKPEDIDQELFSSYLDTSGLPDPDLLIRTSGELRVSNFLLWQIAYSELYFTPVFWPDFRKKHFYQAIIDYQRRERRFGKLTSHLASKSNDY